MLVKHFFSVPVPQDESGKIELFRQSFGIEQMIAPHISIFSPNEELRPRDLTAAIRSAALTPEFSVCLGNVVSWVTERRVYVVVLISGGKESLTEINSCLKRHLNGHHSHRPYIPHITIGQFSVGDDRAVKFEKAVKKSLVGVLGCFSVKEIKMEMENNGCREIEKKISLSARNSRRSL